MRENSALRLGIRVGSVLLLVPCVHVDQLGTDDLVLVGTFAALADVLDHADVLEHTELLEGARGEVVTLARLRNEVDVNTSDIDVGIGLLGLHVLSGHAILLGLDTGLEHAQAVPLHGLAAAEQLNHDGGELLNDTLDDVSRVDGLREGHALNQTTERQGFGSPGDGEIVAVDTRIRVFVLPVGYRELDNFSCHNFNTIFIQNVNTSYQASVSASNLSYLFPTGICDVPVGNITFSLRELHR